MSRPAVLRQGDIAYLRTLLRREAMQLDYELWKERPKKEWPKRLLTNLRIYRKLTGQYDYMKEHGRLPFH